MPYVYSHQALSSEGRAARSLTGTREEDRNRWLYIQTNTFTNWVNEKLAQNDLKIEHFPSDLCDGVILVELVQILRNEKCGGKIYRDRPTEIQMLMNAQMALDALQDDGLKLVNIGSYDIIEGNSKLVLGLIWSLILRYQIARKTRIPPKKLMLTWIQAVLPELQIRNFSSDWNDGVALSALIEYCKPGTFPNWSALSPSDSLSNCERAIQVAQDELNIPSILSPQDLSSSDLDDLSTMTYISYFVKEGAPGYLASLSRVQSLTTPVSVANFKHDWNDGLALCQLLHNIGINVPRWPHMSFGRADWARNLDNGISAARAAGVKPVLSAQEMTDPEVDHLAVMAYTAHLTNLPHSLLPPESVPCFIEPLAVDTHFTHHEVNIDIVFTDEQLKVTELGAELLGPGSHATEYREHLIRRTVKGAVVSFVPLKPGLYQVRVLCNGQQLTGSPVQVQVIENPSPPLNFLQAPMTAEGLVPLSFSGLNEPCAVGSLVEVVINAHGQSQGQVVVEAAGPSGKLHKCPVAEKGGSYTATFTPTEVGEWQIGILYDGEHIKGSPFACDVYDANMVQVYGLDVGVVGQELKFNVNTTQAGYGDLKVMAYHHGRQIPSYIQEQGPAIYRVQFTPDGAGQYKIHIYFNNMEVKGSPFILDIVDASSVSVYGENLRMASVDKLSTFMIHAVGADSKDITVSITAPSGKKKRAQVIGLGDSSYRVDWKPAEAGEHYIDVRLYNQSVHDSPFTCNVGDPDLVSVRNMPTVIKHSDIGETHSFEIDASMAGSGNLEIMINGGRVACRVRELGHRHYMANFVPTQPVTHVVEMRFNGDPVKGSPWRVDFSLPGTLEPPIQNQTATTAYVLAPLNMNYSQYSPAVSGQTTGSMSYVTSSLTRETAQLGASEIEGIGLKQAAVGKVSSFEIGAQGVLSDDIHVKLTAPSGTELPCKIITARTGNYRCEYVPTEVGSYLLDVTVANSPLVGSPFTINAYAPHKVYIDPIPGGAVGKPVQFYVDATEAGKGQLEISVNDGQVPNSVEMQGTGRCLVTFIPSDSGTYVINVTFNDELVRGCPVRVEVVQERVTRTAYQSKYARTESEGSHSPRTLTSPGLIQEQTRQETKTVRSTAEAPQSFVMLKKQQFETRNGSVPSSQSSQVIEKSETKTFTTAVPKPYKPYRDIGVRDLSEERTVSTEEVYKKPRLEHQSIGKWYETKSTVEKEFKPAEKREYELISSSDRHDYKPAIKSERHEYHSSAVEKPTIEYEFSTSSYTAPVVEKKEYEIRRPDYTDPVVEKREYEFSTSSYTAPVVEKKEYEIRRDYTAPVVEKREYEFTTTSIPRPDYTEPVRDYEVKQSEIEKKDFGLRREYNKPTTEGERYEYHSTVTDKPVEYEYKQTTLEKEYLPQIQERREYTSTFAASDWDNKQQQVVERDSHRVAAYGFDDNRKDELGATVAAYGVEKEKESSVKSAQYLMALEKVKEEKKTSSSSSESEDEEKKHKKKTSSGFVVTSETKTVTKQPSYDCTVQPVDSSSYEQRLQEWGDVRTKEVKSDTITTTTYRQLGQEQQRAPLEREESAGRVAASVAAFEARSQSKQEERKDSSSESHSSSQASLVEEPKQIDEVKQQEAVLVSATAREMIQRKKSFSESSASSEDEVKEKVDRRIEGSKIAESTYLVKEVVEERAPVIDWTDIRVEGQGVGVVRIGKGYDFVIEPLKCKREHLRVVIVSPSKRELPCQVTEKGQGYRVLFSPTEVGTHRIYLYVGEVPHPASPFVTKVYDPTKIIVSDVTGSRFPDAVKFTVDANKAGYGSLEIAIKDDTGTIIPSHVNQEPKSNAKFVVSFLPPKAGKYLVDVSFNQENLKGSPFSCEVTAPPPLLEKVEALTAEAPPQARLVQSSIDMIAAGQLAAMLFRTEGRGEFTAQVLSPNGQKVPCKVLREPDDCYRVEFEPNLVGDHSISVRFADMDVQDSPFTCRVYDASCIRVGEIPSGIINKPVHFVVDASEAGVGNLEVAVNEGRIPSMAHSLGQHRYDISFVPREAEVHTVSIKFNAQQVPGSPFTCKIVSSSQVTASGIGLERIPVKRTTEFMVDTQDSTLKEQPQVEITDPNGSDLKALIIPAEKGTFRVEYTPSNVGSHQIVIVYGGSEISGSPFTAKAYDSTRVKLFPVEGNIVGRPANFYIDAAKAGAGNMEIIVSVDGRNVPNFVQAEGNAKFKVSFTPQEPKKHIVSVKFNGESVPGSPTSCDVVEGGEWVASGDGLKQGLVGQPASFSVEQPQGSPAAECNVVITAPDGKELQVDRATDDGVTKITFKPSQVGTHQIDISSKTEGQTISFYSNIYDPSLVKVSALGPAIQGKPFNCDVDTSNAGEGLLEARVENSDGQGLDTATELTTTGLHRVWFKPVHTGKHYIWLNWNGQPTNAVPITINVLEMDICRITGDGLKLAQVDQPAQFIIELNDAKLAEKLSVKVVDQFGDSVPCALDKASSIKFKAEYVAKHSGAHHVEVKLSGSDVDASPYAVEAFDLSAVRVLGLRDAQIGREMKFTVDYTAAGHGPLEVAIGHKGQKAHHRLEIMREGMALVSFIPKKVGAHKVNVMFCGVRLPECPYEFFVQNTYSIRADGPGLHLACVDVVAHFLIVMDGAGRGELDVLITASDGGAVPVKCFQQKDGNFRVEYTPTVIGTHKIDVTFAEQPISGSPFECDVIDPSSVHINSELRRLVLRQESILTVSKKDAGQGEIELQILDQDSKAVPFEVVPSSSGDVEYHFVPTSLGEYKAQLSFEGFNVPGSPINFSVEEASRPMAHGEGLQRALVNEKTQFVFDSQKTKGGLKVEIEGPKSKSKHTSSKTGDGLYEIGYTPIEAGFHTVNIYWNNKPIHGSPFSVPVLDPTQVRIVGTGLDNRGNMQLTVNEKKELLIDATEAGPGQLRAEMRGPNGKIPLTCDELSYGKYRIGFTPKSQGEHSLYLYYADLLVPASPIQGWAETTPIAVVAAQVQQHEPETSEAPADHLRVVLKGEGLKQAKTKDQAEFVIDGSDAGKGEPTCSLFGHKADIPVRLTSVANQVWKATYTPLVAGNYQLEVLWNEKHVRGSPFKVNVEASAESSKIKVAVDQLKMGIVGEELKTTIDTRLAGPGQLSTQCMGPSKLAYCELYDHRDGTYTLYIRPTEVGKHTLVVKYDETHVEGSPYTIYVSNPPEPNKVRVYGNGVEHGILSRFKSNFIVETKGAGAGQLTVRVRGPRGAFNVEMQRERKQDRTIHCKYEPREPGDYQVEVKWAGEHVPGSPFYVMIFDTQQELDRYMAGQPPSPTPQAPFMPPGWMGPPPPGVFMPRGQPPPMLALPPPPPPNFPQPALPYASSTLYSNRSGKHKYIQNGY